MTHYEKLIAGTKEDMVNEIVLVAKWARNLSKADWNIITTGWGGLEKFVRDALDMKYINAAPTPSRHTCKHVNRTFDDRDGPQYWCMLYNKECNHCQGED